MRERERIMAYVGLALTIAGFLVILCGDWGRNCGNKAAIIAMFIVIAYFILCSISIRIRKKCKTGWIQWLSKVAMQTDFGYLALFLGVISFGNSLIYSHQDLWGLLVIFFIGYPFLGYGVIRWGIFAQPERV